MDPQHLFNQLPPIQDLLERAKRRFECPRLNAVLINWYRNGQDYMGFHADDERELGPQPRIVSVSIGAERDFVVKSRHQSRDKVKIRLANGSGLLMAGGMQCNWLHGVPKRAGVTEDRINLTFRYISNKCSS
jgi:alkylated DNA repair dioxygenase AlkB